MTFTILDHHEQSGREIDAAAAVWLARRDRGLTEAEQQAFARWLQENVEHEAAIAKLERWWRQLSAVRDWERPADSLPHGVVRATRRGTYARWTAMMAAAAALVMVAVLGWPERSPRPVSARGVVVHPGAEQLQLGDGSFVALNTGARIDVRFSAEERRVLLVSGEAHFAVAKNPARPFVVEVEKFAVRAVGTAFAVRLDQTDVSVLVTEGAVQLDKNAGGGNPGEPGRRTLAQLEASQQARLRSHPDTEPDVLVRNLSPTEIEMALAWQGKRLEFADVPLRDVVVEFNRCNARQLVIGSAEAGEIVVGGIFRADNLDTFVRLLDVGFDVIAEPRGNEIILRRRKEI